MCWLFTTQCTTTSTFFIAQPSLNPSLKNVSYPLPRRADSWVALEVMSEQLSVWRAVSTLLAPISNTKNTVIRANIASLLDTTVTKLTPERLYGSSQELQELVSGEGGKDCKNKFVNLQWQTQHSLLHWVNRTCRWWWSALGC